MRETKSPILVILALLLWNLLTNVWCSGQIDPSLPGIGLITYQEINILLFGVFMILGKQKTPGDIPPGVFCFPQGKQKTPSAIHIIL